MFLGDCGIIGTFRQKKRLLSIKLYYNYQEYYDTDIDRRNKNVLFDK